MPVAGVFTLPRADSGVEPRNARNGDRARTGAGYGGFELEDLKWVILMVLFNIPGCENAYQQMEELLFEVNEGMLH